MYHYYALAAYLAVNFYRYSGVIDTTIKVFKDVGSLYTWMGWLMTRSPQIEDSKYSDWVLILEDDDSPLITLV